MPVRSRWKENAITPALAGCFIFDRPMERQEHLIYFFSFAKRRQI
jgi:hypothetical protein